MKRLFPILMVIIIISGCKNPVDNEENTTDGSIPNNDKTIISFEFQNTPATISINNEDGIINAVLPFDTNISSLTPIITFIGKSISPCSGIPQNFFNQIEYIITANDKSRKTYIVDTRVAPNSSKSITQFSFPDNPYAQINIHENEKIIDVLFPYDSIQSDYEQIPEIVHTGIKIIPQGAMRYFRGENTYTVTASDLSTQDYLVKGRVSPQVLLYEKKVELTNIINSFSIDNTKYIIYKNQDSIGNWKYEIISSSDDFVTFSEPHIVIDGSLFPPYLSIGSIDIAMNSNILYCSFTLFNYNTGATDIYFFKGDIPAFSFDMPTIISDNDSCSSYISKISVNNNGKIGIIWIKKRYGVFFSYSEDNGLTFSRSLISPNISVGPNVMLCDDSINLAWVECFSQSNTHRLQYSRSTDNGKTFSTALTIDSSNIGTIFTPEIKKNDNNIFVSYVVNLSNVKFAKSCNNGISFDSPIYLVRNSTNSFSDPIMCIENNNIYLETNEFYNNYNSNTSRLFISKNGGINFSSLYEFKKSYLGFCPVEFFNIGTNEYQVRFIDRKMGDYYSYYNTYTMDP